MRAVGNGVAARAFGAEAAEAKPSCDAAPEAKHAANYAALYQRHVDREAWEVSDTSRLPEALKQITSVAQLAAPVLCPGAPVSVSSVLCPCVPVLCPCLPVLCPLSRV